MFLFTNQLLLCVCRRSQHVSAWSHDYLARRYHWHIDKLDTLERDELDVADLAANIKQCLLDGDVLDSGTMTANRKKC